MTPESAAVSATDDDLVSVTGELDAASCPPVRAAVIDLISRSDRRPGASPLWRPRVVLDLSAVSFADSSALSLLLQLDARASAKGLSLALVVATDTAVARVLDRTGLSAVLTVTSSVEQARAVAGP